MEVFGDGVDGIDVDEEADVLLYKQNYFLRCQVRIVVCCASVPLSGCFVLLAFEFVGLPRRLA